MTEPTTAPNPPSDHQSFLDSYREILTEMGDLSLEDQVYALHFFLYDALRRADDLEDDNADLEQEVARLDAPPSTRERAAEARVHMLYDELERTKQALDHSERTRREALLRLSRRRDFTSRLLTERDELRRLCRNLIARRPGQRETAGPPLAHDADLPMPQSAPTTAGDS